LWADFSYMIRMEELVIVMPYPIIASKASAIFAAFSNEVTTLTIFIEIFWS
jgi:hypothetical protein